MDCQLYRTLSFLLGTKVVGVSTREDRSEVLRDGGVPYVSFFRVGKEQKLALPTSESANW